MEQLPDFERLGSAMMFVPNIEVSIERLHAFVSQRVRIAHHHAPAYISIQLRKHEITRAHEEYVSSLLDCLEQVPSRRHAVMELGLVGHP